MTLRGGPIDRRTLLAGLGGLGLAVAGRATAGSPAAPGAGLRISLAALEQRSGGRLGLAVLDGKDGTLMGHRLDERFTHCSTFKLSLAAAILARVDSGRIARDAMLPITPDDPVGHSPVVRAELEKGTTALPILALAEAAQTQSDNGAADILLRKIGGPQAITAFWRSLGDTVSRLDRYEPELNTSHGSDPRDTTTPAAMARTLRAILTGPALKPASRKRLVDWTIATRTGTGRLRAGLPKAWRAGDKTGSMLSDGSYADKYNDIAVCWRPGRPEPFFIAAYYESPVKGGRTLRAQDEAVLARAAAIAAEWMKGRP